MKMITGCNGFIGSHFAQKEEKYIGVEAFNAVHMIEHFPNWDDIDEIIHIGAICIQVPHYEGLLIIKEVFSVGIDLF